MKIYQDATAINIKFNLEKLKFKVQMDSQFILS